MHESRIRLLVLYADYTRQLSYFDDWLDALRSYPGFSVVPIDIVSSASRRKVKDALREVDAVVLLHSTNGDITAYLEGHAAVLAERQVPLLTFVGNEVNLPGKSISAKRRLFERIRPDWIATQLLEEAGRYLFGDLCSRGIVTLPHALNVNAFKCITDLLLRPIDIGTRVMRYSPHIGDDDRNRIADRLFSAARERRWEVDISNQRYDRSGWALFLNRCKGTVSTEAGSWFLERDDATVEAIRRYTRERVGGIEIAEESKAMKVAHRLPRRVRKIAARVFRACGGRFENEPGSDKLYSYEDVYSRFFAGKPRAPVYGKCISSRHFDAIGTKTCQLMFRGRFNDLLEADRHYLAIDEDFANLDEVLRRFADAGERIAIAEAAYAHVLQSHTYHHRMQQLEATLRLDNKGKGACHSTSGTASTGGS